VQNHLNDGLVTITNQETSVEIPPVKYVCDPVSQQMIAVPADYGNPGISYTANQLYSFNQKVLSQQVIQKSYSSGPFVKDIFGIIPLKVSGMSVGSVYVEFGGTLQNQDRIYFGPVNISRMKIQWRDFREYIWNHSTLGTSNCIIDICVVYHGKRMFEPIVENYDSRRETIGVN
jgi:hypothetical protein